MMGPLGVFPQELQWKEEALLCEGAGFLTEACKGHLRVEHPSLVSSGMSAKSPKLLHGGYLQTHRSAHRVGVLESAGGSPLD